MLGNSFLAARLCKRQFPPIAHHSLQPALREHSGHSAHVLSCLSLQPAIDLSLHTRTFVSGCLSRCLRLTHQRARGWQQRGFTPLRREGWRGVVWSWFPGLAQAREWVGLGEKSACWHSACTYSWARARARAHAGRCACNFGASVLTRARSRNACRRVDCKHYTHFLCIIGTKGT